MSRRGTTPTHIFKTSVDLTNAQELFLTYKQGNKLCFEKTIEDVTIERDEEEMTIIKVTLSQVETLSLKAHEVVDVQARVKLPNEKAIASDIINVPVSGILKEGVI